MLAALLVPLALMIGLRSAWALYACRVDGVVRASCCCHGKHEHKRPVSNDTSVAAASCCDVTIQTLSRAPEVRAADRTTVQTPPAVLAPAPIASAAPFTSSVATIARAIARPPPVATFLIKQSFLR